MAKGNEPQSYGSEGDWASGKTGQDVNRLKGHPNSQRGDFYESRHSDDEAEPASTSPVQIAEREHAPASTQAELDDPAHKVAAAKSGARRDGYFKRRDY